MRILVDVDPEVMEITIAALPQFVRATTTGLELEQDLTFEEWEAIGVSFGRALQTAAWCIGDWMVYGERRWGKQLLLDGAAFDPNKPNRIPSDVYDSAVAATGVDREKLFKFVYVCKKIPKELRMESLSFTHHRIISFLPPEEIKSWTSFLVSETKSPTVKHLSLSIKMQNGPPRLARKEEIEKHSGSSVGHDNYIPHLTRLLTCLRKTIPEMDEDQLDALKADTAHLLRILEAL